MSKIKRPAANKCQYCANYVTLTVKNHPIKELNETVRETTARVVCSSCGAYGEIYRLRTQRTYAEQEYCLHIGLVKHELDELIEMAIRSWNSGYSTLKINKGVYYD